MDCGSSPAYAYGRPGSFVNLSGLHGTAAACGRMPWLCAGFDTEEAWIRAQQAAAALKLAKELQEAAKAQSTATEADDTSRSSQLKKKEKCVLVGSGGTYHPAKQLACRYLCQPSNKQVEMRLRYQEGRKECPRMAELYPG